MIQTQRYLLQGEEIKKPIDWRGVRIIADFDGNVQPKLNIESLTFVDESLQIIKDHIDQGRIFEGMDLQITVTDENNTLTAFDGFLNPSTYKQITPTKAEARIIEKNGLGAINDRLEGVTSLLLYSRGYLRNQKSINFAVEPKIEAVYLIVTSVSIFLLSKTLYESVRDISQDNGIAAAFVSASVSGSVAAFIYTAASVIFTAAYYGVLVIAIVKLVNDLISKFIQPIRQHKAVSWLQVLEDCSDFLGLKFNTSIPNLDNYIQIPNNLSPLDRVINGIPKPNDFGYNMQDFFSQVLTHFNSQLAVIDGVIELHPIWSDFWIKNTTYKIPSNIDEKETFRYNTDEVIRSRELIYQFDLTEEYTANEEERVQGGSVLTQGIQGEKDLLKGLQTNTIFHALGSRKTELTALESIIKELAKLTDSVVNTVGGSSNLQKKVLNRVGAMRVSTPNHGLSKLVYSSGGNLPRNHTDFINAQNVFNDYYLPSSFVDSNQKKIYEGVKVPFNLESFNEIRKNSYFIGNTGVISKINRLQWEIDSDFAIIDYEENFIYTNKLKENTL